MTHLSTLGASTAGIWTRAEALALLRPSRVATFVDGGSWQVPFPGVYADRGHELDPVQRAFACALATGYSAEEYAATSALTDLGAVVCGRTAARVWEMTLIDDEDPATGARQHLHHDVSTWRSLRDLRSAPAAPDAPVHVLHRHQLALAPADVVKHACGLWVTSRERTLLDLAWAVSEEALVCAIDRELNRENVALADLHELAVRRKGLRWAPRLRTALSLADPGAESPAETLARLILKPVLPGLRTQVRLQGPSAVIARFDLADEELRLAIEADGKRGHAGAQMVAKDRARDRASEALGWHTERATWWELRCRQDEVRRRVLAVADRRRRTAA